VLHLLVITQLVLADAPPCVAAKHNPCSYTGAWESQAAASLAVVTVLAVIAVCSALALGRMAARRRRRERV
jgi:ABC-type proline/glycine betaine transport system permease subunit